MRGWPSCRLVCSYSAYTVACLTFDVISPKDRGILFQLGCTPKRSTERPIGLAETMYHRYLGKQILHKSNTLFTFHLGDGKNEE